MTRNPGCCRVTKSFSPKILDRESRISEDFEKQPLGNITGVDWNDKHRPFGMFEDQVRAGLPNLSISLSIKEAKKFGGLRHLVDRERDRLGIYGSCGWNGFVSFSALLDVKAHSFQDAALGVLDRFAQAVYTREVVAIRVVFAAFSFDGYRVTIEGHFSLCYFKAELNGFADIRESLFDRVTLRIASGKGRANYNVTAIFVRFEEHFEVKRWHSSMLSEQVHGPQVTPVARSQKAERPDAIFTHSLSPRSYVTAAA